LFSPTLIRSLASFLPPSSFFFRTVLSSSVIVYIIDFFVSLALGPLDPNASWLLFFLEIFISCSLDFAWSCCALNPKAAARSVFSHFLTGQAFPVQFSVFIDRSSFPVSVFGLPLLASISPIQCCFPRQGACSRESRAPESVRHLSCIASSSLSGYLLRRRVS
jgi:hypothetical protein